MPWRWWKKADRQTTGDDGERVAARYLRARGFRILHKNFRLGHHELDLIARDGDTVVFVEVRTRTVADGVRPEETIGPVKQQRLRTAAAQYIARHGDGDTHYRFDVVAVVDTGDGAPEITHIPDAFPGG